MAESAFAPFENLPAPLTLAAAGFFAQSVADYAKKPAAASVKGAGKFSNGAKADSDMDKFVNSLFGDN